MDIEKLVTPFLKISEEIAFNNTLVIQLVIFLALYFLLKPLLWQPMLAALDHRKALTTGQKEQADAEEAEILRLENEYQAKLKATRTEAAEARAKLRAEAQESAKVLLDGAKNEAGKTVAAVREQVAAAAKQARTQLKTEAESAAQAMTAKILGRTV